MRKHGADKEKEKTPNSTKNTHLEDPPCGTPVDPQCLVQRVVERGAVVSKFFPQRLLVLGLVKVSGNHVGVPILLPRARNGDFWGGGAGRHVTTRPRRHASDTATSCRCPPASVAPPMQARGLARASSPIGPTPEAGRCRRGSPPRPPDRPRWGQVLVEPLTWRLLLLWPPPPAATPWPRPCRAVAHSSPPRSLLPGALSTSAAS
jgi:hypothetical protein